MNKKIFKNTIKACFSIESIQKIVLCDFVIVTEFKKQGFVRLLKVISIQRLFISIPFKMNCDLCFIFITIVSIIKREEAIVC